MTDDLSLTATSSEYGVIGRRDCAWRDTTHMPRTDGTHEVTVVREVTTTYNFYVRPGEDPRDAFDDYIKVVGVQRIIRHSEPRRVVSSGRELDELVAKAVARYNAMSPEEKAKHDQAQRENFVRGQMMD